MFNGSESENDFNTINPLGEFCVFVFFFSRNISRMLNPSRHVGVVVQFFTAGAKFLSYINKKTSFFLSNCVQSSKTANSSDLEYRTKKILFQQN